ncbi:hypothetical protein BU26DRAFT_118808 [Trematosphaeria pertusa]|uniref:Uncharacterized protein n=1 Tax=Trematosphaeria pertusa TaxID=390896 RepID=A0A6A6I0S7_9PLEO|nr:uncharacterized protein BU26DRAFT_118808 [Trematosphaeria pertusa]KAF2243503.1 hypothetical protein BU26DRAFT_118808 [Trematosphaeria pertusa]
MTTLVAGTGVNVCPLFVTTVRVGAITFPLGVLAGCGCCASVTPAWKPAADVSRCGRWISEPWVGGVGSGSPLPKSDALLSKCATSDSMERMCGSVVLCGVSSKPVALLSRWIFGWRELVASIGGGEGAVGKVVVELRPAVWWLVSERDTKRRACADAARQAVEMGDTRSQFETGGNTRPKKRNGNIPRLRNANAETESPLNRSRSRSMHRRETRERDIIASVASDRLPHTACSERQKVKTSPLHLTKIRP